MILELAFKEDVINIYDSSEVVTIIKLLDMCNKCGTKIIRNSNGISTAKNISNKDVCYKIILNSINGRELLYSFIDDHVFFNEKNSYIMDKIQNTRDDEVYSVIVTLASGRKIFCGASVLNNLDKIDNDRVVVYSFDTQSLNIGYDFNGHLVKKIECIEGDNKRVFYESSCKLFSDEVKKCPTVKIKKKDNVNHPSHYTWLKEKCGLEVIDITKHFDNNIGNALKYLLRHGHKEEQGMTKNEKAIEDLSKAKFYIDVAIEMLKEEKQKSN